MKQIRNAILMFAAGTFAALALAGFLPAVVSGEAAQDPKGASLETLLIMACLGSTLACVGYSIGLALPPARTMSLRTSCGMGIAVGGAYAIGVAFNTLIHPIALAAALLGLTIGLTWVGKRRWGSRPDVAGVTTGSLTDRQARRLVRPNRRRR